jgi:hypothetical protein
LVGDFEKFLDDRSGRIRFDDQVGVCCDVHRFRRIDGRVFAVLREQELQFLPGGQMLLLFPGEKAIDFVVVRGALYGVVTEMFVGPFAEQFVVLDLQLEQL